MGRQPCGVSQIVMKTQSAKAKGRRFQQWVRDQLIEKLEVHPEDVESRSMGAGGEDLIMAPAAREKLWKWWWIKILFTTHSRFNTRLES